MPVAPIARFVYAWMRRLPIVGSGNRSIPQQQMNDHSGMRAILEARCATIMFSYQSGTGANRLSG
ncbi:MAG: hypothetical protein NTW26_08560 [bacterium]|nr:hypothetical protein [bacterium]